MSLHDIHQSKQLRKQKQKQKLLQHASIEEESELGLMLPLIRAAGGEQVTLAELKLAGIKAIDIILGQLKSIHGNGSKKILSACYVL